MNIVNLFYLLENCKELPLFQQVEAVCNIIKDKEIHLYWGDVSLRYSIDYKAHHNLQIGKSFVKVKNKDGKRENEQENVILKEIEYHQLIAHIIKSINDITFKEDKEVFIERFIFDYSVDLTMRKHLMSQRLYYKLLEEACIDFMHNIKK